MGRIGRIIDNTVDRKVDDMFDEEEEQDDVTVVITYRFTVIGLQPLLIHGDNFDEQERLVAWRNDPANDKQSTAGDDRSPAWTWQTYLYHDGTKLVIPQQNIMTSLRAAGARIKHPVAKRMTFKSLSQSGMMIDANYVELRIGKSTEELSFDDYEYCEPVLMKDIKAIENRSFSEQVQAVKSLGFTLNVKRASVTRTRKHVRVRPMFSSWAIQGEIMVTEPTITHEILKQHFAIAGKYIGLGDWRPGAPKSPGPFGTFKSKVEFVSSTDESYV